MPESGNLLSQIDTASAAKNPLKALADILKDKDLSAPTTSECSLRFGEGGSSIGG